mmetsp:Transcript_46004/g.103436  ORF Transcript_46004/g.103436 Transcript_46004/m.103436 type:complete len:751 (-) Transcript_46004:56-2308(-)
MHGASVIGVPVFILAGASAGLTIFLTSDLTPYGGKVYEILDRADAHPILGGLTPYQVLFIGCALLVLLGYLIDVHLWRNHIIWRCLANTYYVLVIVCFLAAHLLYTRKAPSVPPLVGFILGSWLVYLLRISWFAEVTEWEFTDAASSAYLWVAAACGTLWIVWASTPWEGLHTTPWDEADRTSIDTQSFVRWCCPLLLALVHLFIGAFLKLRSRMHTREEYALAELKLFGITFLLLVTFTWLAASVAAGDAGLSKMVLRLSVFVGVSGMGYLLWSLGPDRIVAALKGSEALGLLMPILMSDWAKAAFVLIFLPIMPFFLLVEVVHRQVRKRMQVAMMTHWQRSHHRWLSEEALVVLNHVTSWHATSVLTKCMWLGIIYFMVQVGCGRGVVVLLAWICELSASWSLPMVLFGLFVIGVSLFLLPPVPGCPIYIVSSIVVTQRFRFDGKHFLWALFLATCWSTVIKLASVAMQQKLIGEPLCNNVTVKKFIGVHTPEMKAIRSILSTPGVRLDKVIVLVFGPDWPTSVLTGVLKLPLLQMLLGTLPTAFLILPFTLSGSLLVHANSLAENSVERRRYKGLANAMVLLAMIVQMAGMVLIAHFTQFARDDFKAELEKGDWMKDDQEDQVLEAIDAEEAQRERWRERTSWESLPWWVRTVLTLGSVLMSIMMYIILLPLAKPFKDFSLQDKISLDQGVYFLVNPSGWVAIAFLCSSAACLLVFDLWSRISGVDSPEKDPLQVKSRSQGSASYGV